MLFRYKLLVIRNKILNCLFLEINLDYLGLFLYIGCSFKFILKAGVEESIVNAPRITDHGSTV
jgi:hypothetical protein